MAIAGWEPKILNAGIGDLGRINISWILLAVSDNIVMMTFGKEVCVRARTAEKCVVTGTAGK